MRQTLAKLKNLVNDKEWISIEANKQLLEITLERAKQPFYQFEPYYNRTDGLPSWQWQMLYNTPYYKGRVALAGNRTGKTESAIYELCLAITGNHPTRTFPQSGRAWVIGLDFAMAKSIDLHLFEHYMPRHILAMSSFHAQDMTWHIVRPDGGEWTVVFKSSEAGREKFQADKIDIAVFDEEPKKTIIFNEVKTRLIDTGGIWWMAATPINGTAWLKQLSENEDVFSITGTMWNNPYIPKDEIENLAIGMSEEERLVRIEGHYIVFGGKPVFPVIKLQKRLEEIKKQTKPSEGILEAA